MQTVKTKRLYFVPLYEIEDVVNKRLKAHGITDATLRFALPVVPQDPSDSDGPTYTRAAIVTTLPLERVLEVLPEANGHDGIVEVDGMDVHDDFFDMDDGGDDEDAAALVEEGAPYAMFYLTPMPFIAMVLRAAGVSDADIQRARIIDHDDEEVVYVPA